MPLKTKWINILYNVATGSKPVRNFFTPIGAIFYGFLIFVFVVRLILASIPKSWTIAKSFVHSNIEHDY